EYALAAIPLNAAVNDVRVEVRAGDLLDAAVNDVRVEVRAGDLPDAAVNDVRVEVRAGDLPDGDSTGAQVVLAGDVFYSRDMAGRMLAFLDRARDRGADVLVGDPGRAYLPRHRLTEVASYEVPVIRALEDADTKHATVWRLNDAEHPGS